MKVYRSNKLERLADELVRVMNADQPPLAGDLQVSEMIVVGSQGMERWLSHQIAQRLGICAGIEFPFPGQLMKRVFVAALGRDLQGLSAWSPGGLSWYVLDVLPELLEHPAFASLQSYLGDEGKRGTITRRRLQLARRIADTFDRYVAFRPNMVLGWEKGEGEPGDWQPLLWRALVERIEGQHLASLAAELFEGIKTAQLDLRKGSKNPQLGLFEGIEHPQLDLKGIPPRVFLFGISTLPPFHLRVLDALSHHREVHLFTPAPTPQYWGQMKTEREAERLVSRADLSPEELHLVQLPPLLDSFGKLYRDFQDVLLEETNPQEPRDDELFERPAGDTMMQVLSRDLLDLASRGGRHVDALPPLTIDLEVDRSIRVHACHGPTRQVEVLRDALLDLFANEPDLEPRDVVVMTPDLDTYAPIIDALFSDGDGPESQTAGFPRIPFQVADRTLRAVNPVAEALLAILEVARGRFSASGVLDLLTLDVIRERFHIDVEDLPLLREWIAKSRVAWGIDDAHREAVGQPRRLENTWRFGLDRLLLGVARRGHGYDTFQGVLPYDEMEGGEAELLGRLAELIESLFDLAGEIKEPHNLDDWANLLDRTLRDLLYCDGDWAGYAVRVRQEIDAIVEDAAVNTSPEGSRKTQSGDFGTKDFDTPAEQEKLNERPEDIDFTALIALLEGRFESSLSSGGFLTGHVTVSGMVPMRSIPFEVLCLLGMDDRVFPRVRTQVSFDKLEESHLRGDRTSRDDDRAIFLETILSTRRHLLITYTGRSITTNEPIAPAVPVSELLDILDDAFTSRDGRPIREALLDEHPLQAFSPRCFGVESPGRSSEPRSYDRRTLVGATMLSSVWAGAQPGNAEPLLDGPLQLEAAESVTIDELTRFLRSPVEWFLRNTLSLRLDRSEEERRDREPIELNKLEEYDIGRDLLDWNIEAPQLSSPYDAIVASGRLPLGTPSRLLLEEQLELVEPIADEVDSRRIGDPVEPIELDIALDDRRLTGRIDGLRTTGLLRWQYGKVQPKQRLELWVRHLALCAEGAFEKAQATLVGRGKKAPVDCAVIPWLTADEAKQHLRTLLSLHALGRSEPLMFFPGTSLAYMATVTAARTSGEKAVALTEKKIDENASSAARKVWRGRNFQTRSAWGEGVDPWVERILGSPAPCPVDAHFEVLGLGSSRAPAFRALALIVWQPLIELGAAGGVE